MLFIIKNARLSFPSLFKPSPFGDSEPKYSATLLIPKGSDMHKALEAEIKRVYQEGFKQNAKVVYEKQMQTNRKLIKDGDSSDGETSEGEKYDGYAGNIIVKASSKTKPKVVDKFREELSEESGLPYAGCYVNAQVEFWPQDNKFGRFVNCKLLAIQFWADGEAFSGSGTADLSAFDVAEGSETPNEEVPW